MQFMLRIGRQINSGREFEILQERQFENVNKLLRANDQTTTEITQMIFSTMHKHYGLVSEGDKRVISACLQDQMFNRFVCTLEDSSTFFLFFEDSKPTIKVYKPELLKPTCSGLTSITEISGKFIPRFIDTPHFKEGNPVSHAIFGAQTIKAIHISSPFYNIHSTYLRKE